MQTRISHGRRRDRQLFRNRKKMILDLLSTRNYIPMRAKDIAMLLQIPRSQRAELLEVLEELVKEGKADVLAGGKYSKTRPDDRDNRQEPDAFGRIKGTGARNRREEKRGRLYAGERDQEKKVRLQAMNIQDIVDAYELPEVFSPRVQQMAERCPNEVISNDFNGRMDLRDWQMVTIDGEDARDLDDAVSLTMDGEEYLLGVHIADVSNYVQAGSALDREALKRGTSVYLPDRVIPMLPKELSNGICSLNQGEDRLALSCLMWVSPEGKVIRYRIAETVIHVNRRMTYTVVNRLLTEPENCRDLTEEYSELLPMFRNMGKLSALIRNNRKKRGAIEFEFPESKVILDEEGNPSDIIPQEANTATRLIEDFMLLANETVAREYCTREIPFLYRTHEKPDGDRMEGALHMIRDLGISVSKRGHEITPAEVQGILTKLEGSPEEPLVSRLLLRSMSRAVYTTECVGHFGLAADYYCHFTSPIRRYPDLQIHRIIKDDLRGRLEKGSRIPGYRRILPEVARQSSAMEQRAQEVEREAVKLKKAEYMLEHLGEEFEGVISGVTGWGFYVELPNTVEGLVHMLSLKDDYYEFDEENYRLIGEKTGRIFSMGQNVRVRVKDAAPVNRTIDFTLADE